jgi:hypothetical protein
MLESDPAIDALVARFPRLFRGKHPQVASSVPPGWSGLIDRMLADIDGMLDDRCARRFELMQIKEKFGGLRVYWRLGRRRSTAIDAVTPDGLLQVKLTARAASALEQSVVAQIDARVQRAETEASGTCQRCGRGDARRRSRGWLVTLCDVCEQQEAES